MDWIAKLGIKHFRGVLSRDGLPRKIRKECGIINLDDIQRTGTHWVCYSNLNSVVEYFDPFGLIMPNEAAAYFNTSGKRTVYSIDGIQNRSTVLCGYWSLHYLSERQQGNRPFPHYAPVSKHKEMKTRLGWTISYKSLYFVHPSLELVPLFTGMRERSIVLHLT